MDGRDAKGRFLPGHKPIGNKGGRPSRSKEERYLRAMSRAVSITDWIAATKAVLAEAMEGDVGAWKALAPYFIGLPVQRIEAEVDARMSLEQWRANEAERARHVEEL